MNDPSKETIVVCMSVWVVIDGERRSLGDPRTWDVPHQQWMSISAIDEIARERARRGLWAE